MTDKKDAIATSTPSPLFHLTDEQKTLLKDTICKGATDNEFDLATQQVNRLQLDPFARQIFFVKRWDRSAGREIMSTQVSIDGLRLVAQRTGEYRGQTEPQWCGPDGQWVNVWLSDDPPAAARCGVYRAGFAEPVYAVARYSSYVAKKKDGKPTQFWLRMPDVMLHKCSEALALRKTFPNELSGVYTTDEMGQATTVAPQAPSGKAAIVNAKLDGDPSSLNAVLAKLSSATTQEHLSEAALLAEKLPEPDKDAARRSYEAARSRVKALSDFADEAPDQLLIPETGSL